MQFNRARLCGGCRVMEVDTHTGLVENHKDQGGTHASEMGH